MANERLRTYESWAQYVAAAATCTDERITERTDREFMGSASFSAFTHTALNGGWSTPQDRALTESIVARVGSLVEIQTYAVSDDPSHAETYDVGALISGDPDHWIVPVNTSTAPNRGRVIRIVSSITASAATSHSEMIRRGALGLAIAEALELAQIPCEIWITDTRENLVEWRMCIKPAGQPTDHERLLIALAHPSTLRRLGFAMAAIDDDPYVRRIVDSGQGILGQTTMPGDIVLPHIRSDRESPFRSDDAAVRWALKALAPLGILDTASAA